MPVPVMGVRDMRMVVRHCQMQMPVTVGLINRPLVLMLVMLVLNVNVFVLQDLVRVLVPVPGGEEHGDSASHEQAGKGVTERCPLAKERYGQRRSGEGCGREERRFAGGAEEPQGVGIEEDAQAVTRASEKERRSESKPPREDGAKRKRETEAHKSGAEGLATDQDERIAKRQALSQVVVDTPQGASTRERQDAETVHVDLTGSVAQNGSATENESRGPRLAAAKVFAKERHGDQNCEWPFEVQQERCNNPGDPLEAPEHQERGDHSSSQGDQSEKSPVPAPEWCFCRSVRDARAAGERREGQADPGAQVQES